MHEGERPDYDRQEEPLGGPVVPINALRATPAPVDGALLALRRGPGFPILSGPELARVLEIALGGGRPARERARERVREILATHEPEPLPEDLDRELRRMIAAREAEG